MPTREPLAVTGMACVFPGAADTSAFWRNIADARVAKTTSLERRWGIPRARYFGEPGAPDRTYMDQAFCLAPFDAAVGGADDVQVRAGRHVLSASLADAALAGAPIDRARTGLVLATSWSAPSYYEHDVARVLARRGPALTPRGEPHAPERQLDAIAGELRGPRFAVDTACASSLYALDAAHALLSAGEADAAVVMGLNVFLPPFLYLGFAKLMALAPDGIIRPFADGAAGIVPGEGAGALVVEPLSRALAAGRRVLGVVRSVGLAADGAERSVFAPGAEGQKLAYARAYAGLDPADVDYVEAHGTATVLGDETELGTLDAFFGARRAPGSELPIGSVKGLVGHTLAAAGVASMIKVLLMLRERTLPPHLDVSPHPRLAASRLSLPRSARPWAAVAGRPRRAGVSSFGFGGANAHVVVEEAPAATERRAHLPSPSPSPAAAFAIVDLECAFGDSLGAVASARFLGGDAPAASRTFPARVVLDAASLRMGPRFLQRTDPLQLLATHLVRDVLVRNEGVRGSERTASVFVSNLGGDTSLRLARRLAKRFRDGDDASLGPDLTAEAIASSLPTMCSGYPAYHFDLRAMHETLAGDAGTFLLALSLAPAWLDERCDALLLGAARVVKTPSEWSGPAPQGEGAAVFLLKSAARARADGDRVLGLLRPLAPSDHEPRAAAREVIELSAGHALGAGAQEHAGFLAEATGVEALARALTGAARTVVIEARRAGTLVARWLVERDASFTATAARAPRLPIDVAFTREPPPARASSVREPPVAAGAARASTLVARCLVDDAHVVGSFLALQRRTLALLDAPARAARRRAEHVVLRAVTRAAGGGHTAELRVDESHPYFFDHALDHVPGILLVEGILQLAEHAAPGADVTSLDLRFRRFCEKSARVDLTLAPRAADRFGGSVAQAGRDACAFTLGVMRGSTPTGAGGAIDAAPAPADRPLLHKRRAENVLVGALAPDGSAATCLVLCPPEGHLLADGDARAWSPLYLLEASRQAVMLAAHTRLGVPLGRPMNLLSVSLELAAPVRRAAALRLRVEAPPIRRSAEMLLADVRVVILDAEERALGEARIKAQVVDTSTYEQQRKVR